MSEPDIFQRLNEISAVTQYSDSFCDDVEKAERIAAHKVWLQSIRHERPSTGHAFRVGVYIRYFNQTKYENYLSYHRKQFSDSIGLCPKWNLTGFYIDSGSSTPYMENAPEWSRLVEDCMEGKVDLILTQKVSNVSRSPEEVTFCARMLSSLPHPVGIYFISEDIFTLASYYLGDLHDSDFFPQAMQYALQEKTSTGRLLHD